MAMGRCQMTNLGSPLCFFCQCKVSGITNNLVNSSQNWDLEVDSALWYHANEILSFKNDENIEFCLQKSKFRIFNPIFIGSGP
jgi:hypothetical protein